MDKTKKLSIIALTLLIIGIVGGLLTYPQMKEAEPIHEEVLIEDENFHSIEVAAESAEVILVPTNDPYTTVQYTASSHNGIDYSFDVDVENETLKVVSEEEQLQFVQFDFLHTIQQITISLPEKTYESVIVDVINGNVQVEDMDIKDAQVETVNGKLDLADLKTSNISVFSTNGSINLDGIEGDLQGETINGSINVKAEHLDQNIQLENVHGSIEIETNEEPTNATISADVVLGRVEIFGNSKETIVFGDGQHKVNLSSVNGKIIVKD
ncbi:hypothetical protein D8M04_12220 [Oceanobacillus piezotolerans]|uniref:DUF4097 domain-containing protein n=1 Tax=Oceanobacillus piezotolerans TaxID=2448030 RepID=A0A498D502_9BACI|nr:DUF4097 family beta strand repeat-containing protein [Oceanobacillus piezotolerans]RLL43683.1 hypothetical protein D8M04_12220 [Oceanobacillus piezotolerans]